MQDDNRQLQEETFINPDQFTKEEQQAIKYHISIWVVKNPKATEKQKEAFKNKNLDMDKILKNYRKYKEKHLKSLFKARNKREQKERANRLKVEKRRSKKK